MRIRRFLIVVTCVIVAILCMFCVGPFMLVPYFTTSQHQQYLRPIQLPVREGKFLYFITTTTSISNDLQDEDIDIYSAMFLSTDYKRTGKLQCPKHFTRVTTQNNPSELPCVQGWQEHLSFVGLDSDEDEPPFFTSPVDNSQHTIEYGSDVPFNRVEFHYGLYRFTKQKKCQETSDCEDSKNSFLSEDIDLQYDRENIICFPSSSDVGWEKSGCALPIVLTNSSGCVDDEQNLVCNFVPFFSEYLLPPVTFTWEGFWGWGVIGYFNCLFIFLFLALVHGRNMHVFYLGNYYFFQNFVTLKEGIRYDYKLKIRGQQFTTSEGCFTVSTPSNRIHAHDLRVEFPASELEGSRNGCVVVRGSFVPLKTTEGCQVDILWEQQFQEADSAIPLTDITVSIHVPTWLKTKWNVLLMPFIMFYGVVIKRIWRTPQLVKRYKLLEITIYITLVHLTWIITIIYIIFYFISWDDDNHAFWGDLNHRPVIPMFLYVLFMLVMFLCIIFALAGSRRYFVPPRKKVTHCMGRILKPGHMTVDLGTQKDDPDDGDVDFSTLQYVPLGRMHAHTENAHVYTQEGTYLFQHEADASPNPYADEEF